MHSVIHVELTASCLSDAVGLSSLMMPALTCTNISLSLVFKITFKSSERHKTLSQDFKSTSDVVSASSGLTRPAPLTAD